MIGGSTGDLSLPCGETRPADLRHMHYGVASVGSSALVVSWCLPGSSTETLIAISGESGPADLRHLRYGVASLRFPDSRTNSTLERALSKTATKTLSISYNTNTSKFACAPDIKLSHGSSLSMRGQLTSPVGLVQVYPFDEPARPDTGTGTDIDIDIDLIAIHGLDTRSPDTWIWRDPNNAENQNNWLQDPKMLPSIVGRT